MNLKPCPFCGSDAELHTVNAYDVELFTVYCSNIACVSQMRDVTKEKATNDWNNRPGERDVAKRIVRAMANEAARYLIQKRRAEMNLNGTVFYMRKMIDLIDAAKIAAKEGGLCK